MKKKKWDPEENFPLHQRIELRTPNSRDSLHIAHKHIKAELINIKQKRLTEAFLYELPARIFIHLVGICWRFGYGDV